jgi:hypothetical protein
MHVYGSFKSNCYIILIVGLFKKKKLQFGSRVYNSVLLTANISIRHVFMHRKIQHLFTILVGELMLYLLK